MEITMRNLLAGGTEVDRRDFLARADMLAACGKTVLISDYFEYYRLAAYLSWRRTNASASSWACRACTSCSTKNITRDLPAAFWRASAGCLKTT